jgi:predicted XRE-type DNA-binding protein
MVSGKPFHNESSNGIRLIAQAGLVGSSWREQSPCRRNLGSVDTKGSEMTDTVEVGSTNVYADLGYPDAEALQRKAALASHIAWTIKARHLTHEAAAELLGIDQADIVKIVRGQFRGTSEAKMLEWIAMLGHDVTILVTKTVRQRPGKIELEFRCSS